MVKKLKTETTTQTISEALEDAKFELSSLAEEMGNWRDNMEGTNLENTTRYEEVSECADTLEDLDSRLQDIGFEDDSEITDRVITYSWSHPYGHNIGRGWRAGYVCAILNTIAEALPDDDPSLPELQDIATELEGLEFPGMY